MISPILFYLLTLIPLYSCKSIYRGVATNAWSNGCQDIQLLSRMSWYYNWDSVPLANIASCTLPNNRVIEYVPMIWGSGSITSNIMSKLPANFTYLMSFNEPNFAAQSNMTPEQAATAWLGVQQQLIHAGVFDKIQIGAPSASPGGQSDPIIWLTQFFGNCSTCRFDFQNFHIYDCNAPYYDAGAVKYWIDQAASFGRPVWLTEFDCPTAATVELEQKWMNAVLPYLDSEPRVARYSWFTARPTNVAATTALFDSTNALTSVVGQLYNNGGDCFIHNNQGVVMTDVNCTVSLGNTSSITSSPPTTPIAPHGDQASSHSSALVPLILILSYIFIGNVL